MVRIWDSLRGAAEALSLFWCWCPGCVQFVKIHQALRTCILWCGCYPSILLLEKLEISPGRYVKRYSLWMLLTLFMLMFSTMSSYYFHCKNIYFCLFVFGWLVVQSASLPSSDPALCCVTPVGKGWSGSVEWVGRDSRSQGRPTW